MPLRVRNRFARARLNSTEFSSIQLVHVIWSFVWNLLLIPPSSFLLPFLLFLSFFFLLSFIHSFSRSFSRTHTHTRSHFCRQWWLWKPHTPTVYTFYIFSPAPPEKCLPTPNATQCNISIFGVDVAASEFIFS